MNVINPKTIMMMEELPKEVAEKVVSVVTVPLNFTSQDIEDIMIGAIEGGINCWGYIYPKLPDGSLIRTDKPKGMPLSVWISRLLLDGRTVLIADTEVPQPTVDEDEIWELTLEKITHGLQLNHTQRPFSIKENYDAIDYDCIIQYSLFGKVVFS